MRQKTNKNRSNVNWSRTSTFSNGNKNLRRMWAFPSVLLLSIVMIFSAHFSIQEINNNSVYQYVWSWTINNDFYLEFGCLVDPLTSI
ncbi:vernalization5/VIN3-like protein, partial [Prunus dulcis]